MLHQADDAAPDTRQWRSVLRPAPLRFGGHWLRWPGQLLVMGNCYNPMQAALVTAACACSSMVWLLAAPVNAYRLTAAHGLGFQEKQELQGPSLTLVSHVQAVQASDNAVASGAAFQELCIACVAGSVLSRALSAK